MENSAIGNTAVPRRIFSSKLEVKPNKTDKTDADIKDKYFDLFDWFCSDQVLEENYFDEKEYNYLKLISDSRGKLMVKLGICFYSFAIWA